MMRMNLMRSIRNSVVVTLAFLFLASIAFGAGTVTKAFDKHNDDMWSLTFTCTGDVSAGTIPNTDTSDLGNYKFYIYRVIIENSSTQTDTDNDADVYIYDEGGTDLLNGEGVDQLDADTRNYIRLTDYEPVIGVLTLSVANQTQASAVWTVTLILVKWNGF